MNGWLVNDESGSVTSLAMLLSIAGLCLYLQVGRQHLSEYPAFFDAVIIFILSVTALFSLGCAVHMAIIGDKSKREVAQDLREKVGELKRIHIEAEKRLSRIESSVSRNIYAVTPRGLDCLGAARRIIRALGSRVEDIDSLVAKNNAIDFMDAHSLLGKKLIIAENCVDSLIDADPLPPLPMNQIGSTLERLLDQFEVEQRRKVA